LDSEPSLVEGEREGLEVTNAVLDLDGNTGPELILNLKAAAASFGEPWLGGVGESVICGGIQRFGTWERQGQGLSHSLTTHALTTENEH